MHIVLVYFLFPRVYCARLYTVFDRIFDCRVTEGGRGAPAKA